MGGDLNAWNPAQYILNRAVGSIDTSFLCIYLFIFSKGHTVSFKSSYFYSLHSSFNRWAELNRSETQAIQLNVTWIFAPVRDTVYFLAASAAK